MSLHQILEVEGISITYFQLYVGGGNKQYLKEIENIKFNKVQLINLCTNGIESVENLNRIWMPSLQKIYLCILLFHEGGNKICNINLLAKCRWPSLKELWIRTCLMHLDDNIINEAVQLSNLSSRKLEHLGLEMNVDYKEQCNDCEWIGKMETRVLKKLFMDSKKRIKWKGQYLRLKNKYKTIEIIVFEIE